MEDCSTPSEHATVPGVNLIFAGEHLRLLPQRAVWWSARHTLFLADMHLGKEATFRAAAIPIPDQTHVQLERLSHLIQMTGVSRIVVLGDMLHARAGRCEVTFELVTRWRREWPDLCLQLVRGNHDRSAGDPPGDWRVDCLEEHVQDTPFVLQHTPQPVLPQAALSGHWHPAVWLHGMARDRVKLPCFVLRDNVLTLPAFSPFVDGKAIRPAVSDRIFGICENRVLDLSVPSPRNPC